MSTKGSLGLFLFCLDIDLLGKIKWTWFPHTRFHIFVENSRSKQYNKKKPNQARHC